MTKAAPDSVVSVRLEMQSFEREQLETLVTAQAVGNVLTGVGAVIAPFGKVLSVVLAAVIAKEGAGWVVDNLNAERVRRKTKNDETFRKEYLDSGSELGYDEWLAERKKKGDYRRWKMAQDLLGRVLWFVDLEDAEPT